MRIIWRFAAVALAVAVLAAPAEAATNRADYVAPVDLICKAAQEPTFKAYAGLFNAIGEDPDANSKRAQRISARALGRFFVRISNIYARATSQIATVAPAPGDEPTVAAWLAARNQAALLGLQAARAAKHLDLRRSKRLANRAVSASEQAASLVSDYRFTFCSLGWGEAISG